MSITEQYNVIIRQGNPNDRDGILALFNNQSPEYQRDVLFWNWINLNLGGQNNIISLAEYAGQIIGHYALIPKTLVVGGSEYPVGMGIHAVVHKNYRKVVSIMDITSKAIDIAKQLGMVMVYGFPNMNYHLIQEKIERWDVVDRFKSIEVVPDIFQICRYRWENAENFSLKSFLREMEKINSKNHDLRIKTTDHDYFVRYLNHPQNLYDSYVVYDDQDPVAFVVLKVYNQNTGHIIDFKIDKKVEIDYFISDCVSKLNCKTISQWNTNSKFKESFCNMFHNKTEGFQTNFMVNFLDKDFERQYRTKILQIDNWHLPMGTSDAF
jgi:hypothetical protein